MIKSDFSIKQMLPILVPNGVGENQIQPASLDIRLGNIFCLLEDTNTNIIDMDTPISYKTITADE